MFHNPLKLPANRKRKPPLLFLSQAILLTSAVVFAGALFFERFRIGFDFQQVQCLDWQIFLIDTHDKHVSRGNIFAFESDERIAQWFPVGITFVKLLAGVPGDQIVVNQQGVFVNQENRGALPLLAQIPQSLEDITRNEQVPDGKLWAMGTAPASFDSRYWGYVDEDNIIGRVYPIY